MQSSRTERFVSPYLLIYAALGLGAGIWAGEKLLAGGRFECVSERLRPDPAWLLLAVPPLLFLAWRGRSRRRLLLPALVLALAVVGVWRYTTRPFEPCLGPGDLASYNAEDRYGRARVLEGVVIGYPDQRESYAQYRVRVDTLWEGERSHTVGGIALVRSDREPLYRYGDRLRIGGAPTTPPVFDSFDYRRFLQRKGVGTLIYRADLRLLDSDQGSRFWVVLYDFRARASGILNSLLSRPYSDLANGMILGIETGIDRDLYEQFNLTGTSHVIVISGSNIAIVSGILLGLFSRALRRRKTLATALTIGGIILYTLLVGADAAVMRAAFMGILYVVAVHLGRQSTAIVSLFVAALLMLALNPLTLWDVGFQLSFMATLGLILFNAPLRRRWDARIGKRLPGVVNGLLAEGLLVTFAAQLTTMSLVVYYFGRLSIISFLANLLIIPVQPPIMLAGGLAVFAGLIFMPLAKLIALVPFASLWWTVFVVQKTASVPWGSLEVSSFGRLISALYTLVFWFGLLWWLLRQEQGATTFIPAAWRPQITAAAAAAALLVLPLWGGATWAESQPDGRLHIQLLGREQAVDFLITTPGGNRILLDPARDAPDYPLDSILASLPGGNRPLNLIIYTRESSDQDSPTSVLSPPTSVLSPAHPSLLPGAVLTIDAGVTLTLLHSPDDPADSLLFLLQYDDFSMLLPFENTQSAQLAALDHVPDALTVLPAPYPGSGHWPHPDLVARLRPQITLLPAGATYPPSVQAKMAEVSATAPIPNNAVVEISSDGRAFQLSARPYAQDVIQR